MRAHRETILKALDIPESKDFATYPFLGNTGTVALPITAALAEDREFLEPGDRVGFLGDWERTELFDAGVGVVTQRQGTTAATCRGTH